MFVVWAVFGLVGPTVVSATVPVDNSFGVLHYAAPAPRQLMHTRQAAPSHLKGISTVRLAPASAERSCSTD